MFSPAPITCLWNKIHPNSSACMLRSHLNFDCFATQNVKFCFDQTCCFCFSLQAFQLLLNSILHLSFLVVLHKLYFQQFPTSALLCHLFFGSQFFFLSGKNVGSTDRKTLKNVTLRQRSKCKLLIILMMLRFELVTLCWTHTTHQNRNINLLYHIYIRYFLFLLNREMYSRLCVYRTMISTSITNH